MTLTLVLAGCANQTSTPSTPQSIGTIRAEQTETERIETATPSIPEESTEPEEPANHSEPTRLFWGSGKTADDPADLLLDLPETLDEVIYLGIGDCGYEPQVLVRCKDETYIYTFSVPELPETLANFAKERGDSYVMIVTETTDGALSEAMVFFYEEDSLVVRYDTTRFVDATVDGPSSAIYAIIDGNIMTPYSTFSMGMVQSVDKVGVMPYYNESKTAGFSGIRFNLSEEDCAALIQVVKQEQGG
ncbi:MAG: hypothetical protein LBM60_03600 [Clostridium sp.]|nr:hypothetical protein [Clostridium sp.]